MEQPISYTPQDHKSILWWWILINFWTQLKLAHKAKCISQGCPKGVISIGIASLLSTCGAVKVDDSLRRCCVLETKSMQRGKAAGCRYCSRAKVKGKVFPGNEHHSVKSKIWFQLLEGVFFLLHKRKWVFLHTPQKRWLHCTVLGVHCFPSSLSSLSSECNFSRLAVGCNRFLGNEGCDDTHRLSNVFTRRNMTLYLTLLKKEISSTVICKDGQVLFSPAPFFFVSLCSSR